jgi:hypothetical protein
LILEALRRGETLTALEALDRFGCNRLAARIRDIRDEIEVDGSTESVESKRIETASGAHVAQYRLVRVEPVEPLLFEVPKLRVQPLPERWTTECGSPVGRWTIEGSTRRVLVVRPCDEIEATAVLEAIVSADLRREGVRQL